MDAPVMRSLPQSIEAEQSVLGSMIIDKNAITKVMEKLRDEDFYRDIAMIINNESQLSSCINHRGEVCEWPQIDFDKQSLVLAQCRVNEKGNDYANAWVGAKTLP